jgi:hypothetical protein
MRYFRYLTIILALTVASTAWADDGAMLRRNVSKTPELETEHAAIEMLNFYVPAQSSDGTLLNGIEYYNADGALVDTRESAKPLIATYQDGHAEEVEGTAFAHGERDAFAAVSLDDGETWKRTNLSNSAGRSSFSIRVKKKSIPYPGDVVRMFTASAENKVLVVWASRYCSGGSPNYAMSDEDREALAGHLGLGEECTDGDLIGTPCLYLEDHFGVSGSQGSSDFADEGYPEVGVVPYSCLWAARGTLVTVDGVSGIDWQPAERLTSGVRDVNRIEAQCVAGAGCAITWQEDPEGLRPGQGEGPGEGWSGAIAHHQTDIWYAYIDWDYFEALGIDSNDDGVDDEFVGIPFSMPVRLTDNAMCAGETTSDDKPYCFADFDETETPDFCAEKVLLSITDPATGQPTEIPNVCVTEDGRLMRGNIAATRARLNLRGYDSDGDGINDSAWVIMAYEESKGLGEDELDAGTLTDLTKLDMGKNIWYHTFDMFAPELVSQGLMLNPPASYPEEISIEGLTADNEYRVFDADPIYFDQAGIETTTLYQTEIARRFSLISQTAGKAGDSKTVAFAMWKQGIIRQGGPADVMARRFVLPDVFDPASMNPYDYANMECGAWDYTDGANPRYIKGLCKAPAIGLSNTTIVAGECGEELTCQEAFPWNAYFDDIEGGTQLAKINEWRWCDGSASIEGCIGDSDFDDNSWDNPYDVAKGHRGFMDGDFIMVLYAWSPNWLANTVGHDNYNLYVRRSFDGGVTWTTTPGSFAHTDGVIYSGAGTTTCEWMGPAGGETEYPVCTEYDPGVFEQARNVSQLVGTKETILDPRYTPTTATIIDSEDDDIRDPSRFFMVYETGDNTTVAEGEAEPLDLFYSRAVAWGDHYLVWAELTDLDTALPSADPDAHDDIRDSGFCNEFDALEGAKLSLSGEAGVTANAGGTFFYGIWNQEDLDKNHNVIGSDAWFRRVHFIDDYIPGVDDGTGDDGTGDDDTGDDTAPGNSGSAPGRTK